MLFTGSNMALPVIKSLSDCADFSKTVEPYLPQLYTFPGTVVERLNNADALKQLYVVHETRVRFGKRAG